MANARYLKAKESFLKGEINLVSDTIKAVLVDLDVYTPNLTTDQYYTDIVAGVVGTPVTLTGKSVTNGVFDADDITFPSVSGASVEAVVIYKSTGVDATSRLIVYLDEGTGLPKTPTGSDIDCAWSDGASKIFS